MKKITKIFIIIVAVITFGLNLSMDSEGKLSWFSETLAMAPPTTPPPPPPQKWKRNLYICYDLLHNVMARRYGCDGGSDLTCIPDPPCPSPYPP